MSPRNDITSVLADPQWLPLHFDWSRGTLQFAWLPRRNHRAVTFLTEQYLREKNPPVTSLPLGKLTSPNGAQLQAPHYIFHSAFCCSTLLTRVLDLPGVAMGLKEPQVLIELALRHMQRQLDKELLLSTSRLLGRPFGQGERIIVKPGNEANNLAEPLLHAHQRSKVILLYAPLPRFLASVAQKGMWGRIWARRLYGVLQRQGGPQFGFTDAQAFELTDLQVAALAWLQHHAQFVAIATAFPGRVRTLDSATFLARRVDTMAAVGSHFDLQLDPSGWQKIGESEVFAAHSKEIGRTFDPDERAQMQPQGRTIDEEIEMVTKWARAVGEQIGLLVDMPAETALVAAA